MAVVVKNTFICVEQNTEMMGAPLRRARSLESLKLLEPTENYSEMQMMTPATPELSLKYNAKGNASTPSTLSVASCDVSDANSEDGNSSSTPAEATEQLPESPTWQFVPQTASVPPLSAILPPEDMGNFCMGSESGEAGKAPLNPPPLPTGPQQQQWLPPQQQQQPILCYRPGEPLWGLDGGVASPMPVAPSASTLDTEALSKLLCIMGPQEAICDSYAAGLFAQLVSNLCSTMGTTLPGVKVHLPLGERKEAVIEVPKFQDGGSVMTAIHVAQNFLLNECKNLGSLYMRGYMTGSIFSSCAQGFEAQCSYIPPEDNAMACWDMHQKGFCPREGKCRWRHPKETLTIRVVVTK